MLGDSAEHDMIGFDTEISRGASTSEAHQTSCALKCEKFKLNV